MKSKTNTIGMSEWLTVLEKVSSDPDPVPPGFYTVIELAKQTGLSETSIRVRIRKAMSLKLLDSLKLRRTTLEGRVVFTPYYRPKKAP